MYDCVVFDKDGTIFDTKHAAIKAFEKASKDLGIEYLPEVLFGLVGMKSDLICKILLDAQNSSVDPIEYDILVSQYFMEHSNDGHNMFPGILDLFQILKSKNIKMCVATGNNQYNTTKLLRENNLTHFFEMVVTADDVSIGKPNPEMLENIGNFCNVPAGKMIMIGDSKQDIFMAQNFGCNSVGVSWGMQPRNELAASNPTFMVDNIDELNKILLC
jgi:HAD superfamily hydrolase (TIGR01549 family)